MSNKSFTLLVLAVISFCISSYLSINQRQRESVLVVPKSALSEYGFFIGELKDLVPNDGVVPYSLNTPLFTDYALKARFVKLPKGTKASYEAKEVFDFPLGTVLIKNFYYPKDTRKPQKGRILLETRLLIHEEKGWKAYPYIWNKEQTDAYLEVAGGSKNIVWVDKKGKKQKLNYQIPNMNQCKGCHLVGQEIKPIGPTARQLNGAFAYKEGKENQLVKWKSLDILEKLPSEDEIPKVYTWNNPYEGTLEQRARGWLDINCGHCHRAEGPANTSGLFLDYHTEDPYQWGIFKTPVAAGRGSGGHSFAIDPGHPENSILVYRMESTDPGEMMPELGRTTVHQEGVALVKAWIKSLDATDFKVGRE
ncbi:MAG: SO2930 family diheme c-type cytochrome [Bacteroidota bacterium]